MRSKRAPRRVVQVAGASVPARGYRIDTIDRVAAKYSEADLTKHVSPLTPERQCRARIADDVDTQGMLVFYLADVRLWDGPLNAVAEPERIEGQTVLRISHDPYRARLSAALRLKFAQNGFGTSERLALIIRNHDGKELARCEKRSADWLAYLDMVQTADNALIDGHPRLDPAPAEDVTTIAFYLPQYFPFRENDEAWGEGFTEWANVLGGKPQYEGQVQPLLPADLGFYDIRLKDVRDRQAELASEYGVDAFCYYFYWFSGRRIMREGLDEILHTGSPNKPFCLCWANETWSRRWDGSEAEIIVKQDHDPDRDLTLFDDLLPYFLDDRYIKVDGSPIFLIYRMPLMKDATRVLSGWRDKAKAAGFSGLKILAIASFGLSKVEAAIADGVVEFPPHGAISSEITSSLPVAKNFSGKIYDYREAVANSVMGEPVHGLTYPGIMPRWGNTARRGEASHIYAQATPSAFKIWATFALERARLLPEGQRFVFINSWNEWAEGAMLEPDRHYGRSFLEALRQARGGYAAAALEGDRYRFTAAVPESEATRLLSSIEAETRTLARIAARVTRLQARGFRKGPRELLSMSLPIREGGTGNIDYCSVGSIRSGKVVVSEGITEFVGWVVLHKDMPHVLDRVSFIVLTDVSDPDTHFHIPVFEWHERQDVADHLKMKRPASESFFGFRLPIDCSILPVGVYTVHICQAYFDALYAVELQNLQRV